MTTTKIERLQSLYPKSHLHCNVTEAGQHTYQIVVSLITDTDDVIATVENYGSGDLNSLKEQTFNFLAEKLQQVSEA